MEIITLIIIWALASYGAYALTRKGENILAKYQAKHDKREAAKKSARAFAKTLRRCPK